MIGVAKEPLLHFLLAGGVLFGVHTWLNRAAENSEPSKARQVHVGAADVQWLAETWARQWRRPPTREELRGLVTDYLNEQLLAREARAIGLDDDDAVVRRRLAQKLTFMIDGTLRHAEPSENELQQFYEKHPERFRTDARISFTHIYFSPERRSNAHSDATDALTLLVKMDAEQPDGELGDRLLIAREFREETEQAISGALGSEFARTVFSLRPGIWSGPVKSEYGLHLVRITNLRTARLLPFPEARAYVKDEWRREQEKSAKETYAAELRKKYDVVVDETAGSLLAPVASVDAANPGPAKP